MSDKSSIISTAKETSQLNAKTELLFGKIQPILLFLPDTQQWVDRWVNGRKHLDECGIKPFHVAGIHAKEFGVTGTQYCFVDQWRRYRHNYTGKEIPVLMPDELKEQWYIGDANVGGCLSHYMLYNIMSAMPAEHFLVLEDDCRFEEGWKEKLEQALKDAPEDFDFLFVGSACAEDKDPVRVKGDVYHFPYREDRPDWFPQTGFCYIVAKKALPTLIATQRTACINVDVQLIYEAFKYLNIYAILPRLSNQGQTHLPR